MSMDEHCPDPAPLSRSALIVTLNHDFSQLISQLDDVGRKHFWQLINQAIWLKIARRVTTVVVLTFLIILMTLYVPHLNWTATAVGRIGLIRLLPFWNWTQFHRDRCIWQKNISMKSPTYKIKEENCDFCESIGKHV